MDLIPVFMRSERFLFEKIKPGQKYKLKSKDLKDSVFIYVNVNLKSFKSWSAEIDIFLPINGVVTGIDAVFSDLFLKTRQNILYVISLNYPC